jgi:hypothetical protein
VIAFLILYAGGGALLTALSVPLIQKRIPPNLWYGFRVRKTLENRDVWYAANVYAGRRLFGSGLVTAMGAIALYFVPGLTLDVYALACAVVTFAALTISVVQSLRYLQTLAM